MVVMRMRQRHHIELLDSTRPQIWRHHVFPRVRPRSRTANGFSARLAATVDQHHVPAGRNHENRIALTHIENAHLEFPVLQPRRKRVSRDY